MRIWIGIDCGIRPTLVRLVEHDGVVKGERASIHVIDVHEVPESRRAFADVMAALVDDGSSVLVEKLTKLPSTKSGATAASRGGAAQFAMGEAYGAVMASLWTLAKSRDLRVEEFTARQWQKQLGIRFAPKTSYYQRKTRLLEHARKLFPGRAIVRSEADAVLLAHLCRLRNRR